MVKTLYDRDGSPYYLNEIMFILWNVKNWGSDPQAIEDIAKLVQRKPRSIVSLIQGE